MTDDERFADLLRRELHRAASVPVPPGLSQTILAGAQQERRRVRLPSPAPRTLVSAVAGIAIVLALVAALALFRANDSGRRPGLAQNSTGSTTATTLPYQLYTHCGIYEALIGKDYYKTDSPITDGNGNPPSGWGNPYQVGTMTLTSPTTAVFTDDLGHRVTFHLRPNATGFLERCS